LGGVPWLNFLNYFLRWPGFIFTGPNVACAIGPRVNTLRVLNWYFPSKPNFSAICLKFQQQNSLRNQCFPYGGSKYHEINSIKSDSLTAFQQHYQIPTLFSVLILFNFCWKNGSVINSFHSVASNSLEPNQCSPINLEFSKDTKSATWSALVWEISAYQNKTNYLASYIHINILQVPNMLDLFWDWFYNWLLLLLLLLFV
jgi:hypothetical protein